MVYELNDLAVIVAELGESIKIAESGGPTPAFTYNGKSFLGPTTDGANGNVLVKLTGNQTGWGTLDLSAYAIKNFGLSQFKANATTAAELAALLGAANYTGTGKVVFDTGPTLSSPTIIGDLNSSGSLRAATFAGAGFYTGYPGTDVAALLNAGGSPSRSGVYLERTGVIRWSSGGVAAGFIGTNNAGLESPSAAILKVTNGSTGYGALRVGSPDVTTPGGIVYTVASQSVPAFAIRNPGDSAYVGQWGPTGTIKNADSSGNYIQLSDHLGNMVLGFSGGAFRVPFHSSVFGAGVYTGLISDAGNLGNQFFLTGTETTLTRPLVSPSSGSFTAPNVTTPAMTLRKVASQTAPILNVVDTDGTTTLASITAAGVISVAKPALIATPTANQSAILGTESGGDAGLWLNLGGGSSPTNSNVTIKRLSNQTVVNSASGYVFLTTATASSAAFSPTDTQIYSPLTVSGTVTCNGTLYPVKATTAGAPTYVLGGLYFDTTLNKLRIGGAAGWETVTSI